MSAKRKYSFLYRVYRKIRYLRYVAKLRKAERKARIRDEKAAYRERRKLIRDQRRSELYADRIKRRQERNTIKDLREKIRAEQQQDFQENNEVYKKELQARLDIRKKNRLFRRYRRKKLTRFYLKTCFNNIVLGLRTLNPANLPKLFSYVRNNKPVIREFAIICMQSTLMFVSAYLVVFLIMMGTEALSGIFFDYSAIVYYYKVLWLVKPEEWFQDSVQLIYASGPIVCGIIAVFFAIVFSYMYADKGLSKLFILWFFIHGFNAFFGALLIGSLFDRGFGYAIIWSYISDTEKVIYSIISILALFLLGVFTTRSFLVSANIYYTHLAKQKQRFFVWAQVILPFVIGNMLIGAIMFPNILWFNLVVALSLVITIVPIAAGYRFLPALYFEEDALAVKIKIRPIILALAFIALYRIILEFGIRIG